MSLHDFANPYYEITVSLIVSKKQYTVQVKIRRLYKDTHLLKLSMPTVLSWLYLITNYDFWCKKSILWYQKLTLIYWYKKSNYWFKKNDFRISDKMIFMIEILGILVKQYLITFFYWERYRGIMGIHIYLHKN